MKHLSLTPICFLLSASVFVVSADTTLKVTTILTEPFAQRISVTAEHLELEGYIIDLLAEISRNTSIQITPVTPVADGQYGKMERGAWNGMIKELVDKRAQLAAAPLTKNAARQRAVRFIDPPFMKFGLSILMKRNDKTSKIHNMIDLSEQGDIKYGIIANGTTEGYFKDDDRRSEYNKMWYEMSDHPSRSLLESVAEGVRRVRESNDSEPFAFIGEKYMLEFHASRKPCELIAVPGISAEEYNGAYHLAVNRDVSTAIRDKLSEGLEHLQNSSRLEQIYEKWWIHKNQCKTSTASSTLIVNSGTAILVPILVSLLFRVSID